MLYRSEGGGGGGGGGGLCACVCAMAGGARPGAAPGATLAYSAVAPPLGVLAAARLGGVALALAPDDKLPRGTPPTLVFANGTVLTGDAHLIRYAARAGAKAAQLLAAADALAATEVDVWLDLALVANRFAAGQAFEASAIAVSDYLALRSYVIGHALTAADVALWHAILSNRMWDKVKSNAKVANLARWLKHVSAVPELAAVTAEFTTVPKGSKEAKVAKDAKGGDKANAGKAKGDEGGSFDIDLPNAEIGKVCTRFPPEPSGTLHLGHTKAALLNRHFATIYKGKMIVRFDDTNPDKENQDFVDSILRDIKSLGIDYDQITYTSDSFDAILKMGDDMVKRGVMYIDNTGVDQMREERMAGVESKNRNNSIEKNTEMWQAMKDGTEEGAKCAARFKMDMQADNKTLRDPVAFRCNVQTPHHRTGTKFKVYPTYDCACPFVDSHEGVTHALRTSEYRDREAQYNWVLKLMQLPKVHIWDFSRLNFICTTLSKRKLQWFVDQGMVSGWDDPRFPTVAGALRRGMQVEALKEFILLQGASRNINLMEWEKIWTINKRMIDPVCPRHTAVIAKGKVPLKLTNVGAPEVITVPKHKKYPPAGNKSTTKMADLWLEQADAKAVKEGEEVTLMDWGNAFIRGIERDADGNVTALTGESHPEGDVKKTKLKLHWLPQLDELVPLEVQYFGHLLTKKKLEEGDKMEDYVNKHSKLVRECLGDPNMRTMQKGDVIQLERVGYFICDEPYTRAGKPMVLLNIPDGKAGSADCPAA